MPAGGIQPAGKRRGAATLAGAQAEVNPSAGLPAECLDCAAPYALSFDSEPFAPLPLPLVPRRKQASQSMPLPPVRRATPAPGANP